MDTLNTLANDPQLPLLIGLLVVSASGLATSLVLLSLERQSRQQLQQRLIDLGRQLTQQQDDYNTLEQLQFVGAQCQERIDQALQDIYALTESNTLKLDRINDQPNPSRTLFAEVPSHSNYEHAIRMAKDGMLGEKIQHICGLTEGEVNLILDLHQ